MTPASTASVEFRWVHPRELRPNTWNPNEMDAEQYARALRSIDDFGFIDPITVRDAQGYEIIDGENRWRAALDRLLESVPIVVVVASDAAAKQLTIVLNEVRGQANPQKLGLLLRDLLATEPQETLLARLPLTREALDRLSGLPTLTFDDLPAPPRRAFGAERPASWVERVYRLPKDAAETLDLAISRWREREDQHGQPPTPDWRVLELICADWLAQ